LSPADPDRPVPPAAALEGAPNLAGEPCVQLSVVVCTYRRVDKLEACLASLAAQSLPKDQFEVIIVNNAPDEAARVQQVVSNVFATTGLAWRVVQADRPGLFHARNAGLGAVQGEIVSFIDDDATASPDWLWQLARAFREHPQAGVIGGHIVLVPPEPRPYVLRGGRERYWSHFVTQYPDYVEVTNYWEFPWGANWSARRDALRRVGGFPTDFKGFANFERRGLAVIGDDLIAAGRIMQLGYRIAILPQAIVYHHVDASRYTLRHIWQRILAATFFRSLARRHLEAAPSRLGIAYERAKIPALLRRQGPVFLVVWEIACHLAARLLVLVCRLR